MKSVIVFGAAVLMAVAAWQGTPFWIRWQVRQLRNATGDGRIALAAAISKFGPSAVAPLMEGWTDSNESACENIEFGLHALTDPWPLGDLRSERTVLHVVAKYARFSLPGKKAALRWAASRLQRDLSEELPAPLFNHLHELLKSEWNVEETRPEQLRLAAPLLARTHDDQLKRAVVRLTEHAFEESSNRGKVAAIQLLYHEPLKSERRLLVRVVPYLRDPEPSLRRAALLTLGRETNLVSEEDLLPLLHDPDLPLRHLVETTLRGRGLTDAQVQLGRHISDPDPRQRLQVIRLLTEATNLDPEAWLQRLTQDPAPAVRAAAVRAAGREPSLASRLEEMARIDPSPTVREIALFYSNSNRIRGTALRSGD